MEKQNYSWIDLYKAYFYFSNRKIAYVIANIAYIIFDFLHLVPPLLVGLIVDFFTNYNSGDSLYLFYLYCFLFALSFGLHAFIRLRLKHFIGGISIQAMYDVKIRGFEKLLNFSIDWHNKENSGNKVQRLNKGAKSIQLVGNFIFSKASRVITSFSGVTIAFLYLDYKYFVLVFAFIFIYLIIEQYYIKRIDKLKNKENYYLEIASGKLFESTNNILSLKTSGTSLKSIQHISQAENKAKDYTDKLRDTTHQAAIVKNIVVGVFTALFLLMLGLSVLNGSLAIAFILTYYAYFNNVVDASKRLSEINEGYVNNKNSIQRMMPIFYDKEKEYFGSKEFLSRWKKIIFQNVNFKYSTTNKVAVENLSLEINKNDIIGVVGKSGSGKSTLVKLLLGLYEIDSGKILIDNQSFYEFSHKSISNNISVALQETELFNLSFKDNLTLTRDIDIKLLNLAIKTAQLEDVIKNLPNGLDTLLGEKGFKLSGGEKQRIGIARAICRNLPILILDEATSALDTITEKKIQKSLKENFKDKTVLIIAHRLSTLKDTDRIIVFDKGSIVEDSSYNLLIKEKKSLFYSMWKKQK